MGNTKVKNLKGSSAISCSCSDYLCHWENYSGKKATVCSALGCSETKNLVGGHVIHCHGNASASQYIVPLGRSCNHPSLGDCFELKSGVDLVAVTNRSRCEAC